MCVGIDMPIVEFTDRTVVDGGTGLPYQPVRERETVQLPFFLDPEQIRELTPEIDWDEQVGARIRAFLEFGRGDRT